MTFFRKLFSPWLGHNGSAASSTPAAPAPDHRSDRATSATQEPTPGQPGGRQD